MLNDTTSRIHAIVAFSPLSISVPDPIHWLNSGLYIGIAYGLNHDWNVEYVNHLSNLRRPEPVFDKYLGAAKINSHSDNNLCINRIWSWRDKYIVGASLGVGINQTGIHQVDSFNQTVAIYPTYGVAPRIRLTLGKGNVNYWGFFLHYSPVNYKAGNRIQDFGTRHIISPGIVIRANF